MHNVQPVIVAGIIVSAAADERVLEHPTADVHGELVRRVASWPAWRRSSACSSSWQWPTG